jgi:hypothetical protein
MADEVGRRRRKKRWKRRRYEERVGREWKREKERVF